MCSHTLGRRPDRLMRLSCGLTKRLFRPYSSFETLSQVQKGPHRDCTGLTRARPTLSSLAAEQRCCNSQRTLSVNNPTWHGSRLPTILGLHALPKHDSSLHRGTIVDDISTIHELTQRPAGSAPAPHSHHESCSLGSPLRRMRLSQATRCPVL